MHYGPKVSSVNERGNMTGRFHPMIHEDIIVNAPDAITEYTRSLLWSDLCPFSVRHPAYSPTIKLPCKL